MCVTKGFTGKDGFTYIVGKNYDLPKSRATSLIERGLVEAVVSREIKIDVKSDDEPQRVEVKFTKEDEEKDGKQ